jgi:hypothetical protein
MKVSYSKDLANHAAPELCGHGRKIAFEALVGVHTGRVLSLENVVRSANVVQMTEGNTSTGAIARRCWALRGRRPRACVEVSCTETGRPGWQPFCILARGGKPKGVSRL